MKAPKGHWRYALMTQDELVALIVGDSPTEWTRVKPTEGQRTETPPAILKEER